VALIETTFRIVPAALAVIATAVFALPAAAQESRRHHSSGTNGQPTRPNPQAAAPVRPAAPAVSNHGQSHARPPVYSGHNYQNSHSNGYGHGSGWIGPRPIYNPPLVVYPAPRIAYIPPPVVYSPPPYYVQSAPVYSNPSVYSSPSVYSTNPSIVITPSAQANNPEQPVWYYCADYREYYPNVEQCPSNWLRVLPDSTAQQ
jgi:hypothetical protein